MRCFLTPDGRVLVEWALSPSDVPRPDGTPLGRASTFYVLDSAGAVAREWTTTSSAAQEHLSTSAYVIEHDALVCYFRDLRWLHEDDPTLDRSIELDGLSPIRPEDAPAESEVREAIERYEAARREAWAEQERVERERLAGFERKLPELAAGERITLVWRYDGPDIAISRGQGDEIWRESDWPWTGKDLYRRLRRVAEEKYGARLAGFEVDVPADEYLRFDND